MTKIIFPNEWQQLIPLDGDQEFLFNKKDSEAVLFISEFEVLESDFNIEECIDLYKDYNPQKIFYSNLEGLKYTHYEKKDDLVIDTYLFGKNRIALNLSWTMPKVHKKKEDDKILPILENLYIE
ncbi:hypothetical protein [Flammeovirga sp. SJP92]|uniref:hypothetical protein n=1 Tax=Flammeovirga sp. SJP92 TaxID=1775430 RepID=UPI0007886307|nr:hypothetical protein [Flammeovirga sp. SJP92]KXX66938.1 hypothetical protein AVL50_29740 [Flammeovirga sp. SJP92]